MYRSLSTANIPLHKCAPVRYAHQLFDQLFVCCNIVYSDQLLVGSSYTVTSYHNNLGAPYLEEVMSQNKLTTLVTN